MAEVMDSVSVSAEVLAKAGLTKEACASEAQEGGFSGKATLQIVSITLQSGRAKLTVVSNPG